MDGGGGGARQETSRFLFKGGVVGGRESGPIIVRESEACVKHNKS